MRDGEAYVGFVFLRESHACIRIEFNTMMLDILSCKPIDLARIEAFLTGRGFSEIQCLHLDRQI